MTYQQTCPRCGDEITGEDKERVADAVVEHAQVRHGHSLDSEIVLAHLDGVRPQ